MSLRKVEYTDREGRIFITQLPEGVPDSQAEIGIPVGPPDLTELHLPIETEVRLNNALVRRELIEAKDASVERIREALMAALKVDAQRIALLY